MSDPAPTTAPLLSSLEALGTLTPEELEAVSRYCQQLEEELKTAQAIQLTALEQAPVGIVVADAKDMHIRLASVTGYGILGKSGMPMRDISRDAHMKGWELLRADGSVYASEDRPLERAISHGEVSEGVDAIIAAADGQQRHVRINAAPVRNEAGAIVAGVAVFLDVTEHKVLEAQRTQTLTFFAHDMKSPLMGAAALTRRLLEGKEGPLTTRQSESIEMIAELQERVLSLSLDFLDVARMGQAGFTLATEPVDMGPLLANLAREYGQRAEDKGLAFSVEIHQDIPQLQGDRQRLMRMVGNLLDNAIKYTPQGGVRLRALLHSDELEVKVIDDGPGVAEEELENLFEKFFRGAAGRGSEGTGVGLAAVKAIAQAHGGRVAAGNMPEQGAVFTIWLPFETA